VKLRIFIPLLLPVLAHAQSAVDSSELAEHVSRMARIGSVTAPSFSPDGRWLSVISNVSGMPQLYVMPSTGGWPRMVTDGADPIVGAVWSPQPGSEWIALTVAPGGGLNT
jgi:Tol biopolymer transport system component